MTRNVNGSKNLSDFKLEQIILLYTFIAQTKPTHGKLNLPFILPTEFNSVCTSLD